jgi:hypothetical protein
VLSSAQKPAPSGGSEVGKGKGGALGFLETQEILRMVGSQGESGLCGGRGTAARHRPRGDMDDLVGLVEACLEAEGGGFGRGLGKTEWQTEWKLQCFPSPRPEGREPRWAVVPILQIVDAQCIGPLPALVNDLYHLWPLICLCENVS